MVDAEFYLLSTRFQSFYQKIDNSRGEKKWLINGTKNKNCFLTWQKRCPLTSQRRLGEGHFPMCKSCFPTLMEESCCSASTFSWEPRQQRTAALSLPKTFLSCSVFSFDSFLRLSMSLLSFYSFEERNEPWEWPSSANNKLAKIQGKTRNIRGIIKEAHLQSWKVRPDTVSKENEPWRWRFC